MPASLYYIRRGFIMCQKHGGEMIKKEMKKDSKLLTPNPKTSMEKKFRRKFGKGLWDKPDKLTEKQVTKLLAFINQELLANDKKWRDLELSIKSLKTTKTGAVTAKVYKNGKIIKGVGGNKIEDLKDSLLERKEV